MKVLTIVAHPDDEVLGCGGTLAKHSERGDECHVLVLGTGIAGRKTSETKSELEEKIEQLRQNGRDASKILGVKSIEFLDFPDQEFDGVGLLKIIKEIEKKVKEVKPDIVYTNHYGDLNIDHQITSKAVMTALRPCTEVKPKILFFEVLSSSEWGINPCKGFSPNVFVDISDAINKKLDAMKQYKGELREFPHPRSLDGIKILSQYRGITVLKRNAEAFELAREIVEYKDGEDPLS